VNDRRFPNEDLATVFDKAEGMAKLMDRLGYNAFWWPSIIFSTKVTSASPTS